MRASHIMTTCVIFLRNKQSNGSKLECDSWRHLEGHVNVVFKQGPLSCL